MKSVFRLKEKSSTLCFCLYVEFLFDCNCLMANPACCPRHIPYSWKPSWWSESSLHNCQRRG